MKCPNDETQMEKGYLTANGRAWIKFTDSLRDKISELISTHQLFVWAWRCPNCKKIELTSE